MRAKLNLERRRRRRRRRAKPTPLERWGTTGGQDAGGERRTRRLGNGGKQGAGIEREGEEEMPYSPHPGRHSVCPPALQGL